MTFALWLCVGLSAFIAVVLAVISDFRLRRVIGLWPVMAFGAGMWLVVLLLASGHGRDRS